MGCFCERGREDESRRVVVRRVARQWQRCAHGRRRRMTGRRRRTQAEAVQKLGLDCRLTPRSVAQDQSWLACGVAGGACKAHASAYTLPAHTHHLIPHRHTHSRRPSLLFFLGTFSSDPCLYPPCHGNLMSTNDAFLRATRHPSPWRGRRAVSDPASVGDGLFLAARL